MTTVARLVITVAGAGAIGAGGFGLFGDRTRAGENSTAAVRRGTLVVTITEAGFLRAASSVTFRSPVEGRELEITWLAAEGTQVADGDLVASLDTTDLRMEFERAAQAARQADLDLAAARLEREEAELALRGVTEGAGMLAVEEGRTELQVLQSRARRLREEQQRLEPLFRKGYVTRDEFDRSGAEADEADARAILGERAFRTLTDRTHPAAVQSARLQLKRREAQIANLEPRLEAAREYVQSLSHLLQRSSIRATHPGLVMYEENVSVMPRRKIRVGDRVTPSQGLVTLPDLRRMTIQASVRESDVRRIAPGQHVRATLDAFPDTPLAGTVSSIGALAGGTSPNAETRFDIAIALAPSGVALRPAMNARVDIHVDERRDVLLVPAAAVFQSNGESVCYVRRGDLMERRVVRTGASNAVDVEIASGLSPGDRVSLRAPGADRGSD